MTLLRMIRLLMILVLLIILICIAGETTLADAQTLHHMSSRSCAAGIPVTQPELPVPHASARAEHDPMIRVRDAHLHNLKHVDVDPGAGDEGGQILTIGMPAEVAQQGCVRIHAR